MSFNYVGSKDGGSARNLITVTLANSETLSVGDCVLSYITGFADVPEAAKPILGIIHSIVRGNAGNLPAVQAEHTPGSANSSDTQTVTTASDNQTTGAWAALIDCSTDSIYSAQVNGTIGTTVTSNVRGAKIDVDAANTHYDRVLETTATRTIGTPANFYSYGTDPNNTGRLLVSIAMSELNSVLE